MPREWRVNRHGRHAATEVIGRVRVSGRRGRVVIQDIRICPVTYTPSHDEIVAARRGYLDWWTALLHVRRALVLAPLACHRVTTAMPPARPWRGSGS